MLDTNKVLIDCKPEWVFWLHNGVIVRNIYELAKSLDAMNEEDFIYHVNDDNNKNDFALWIEAVLEDKTLADNLKNVRNKKRYSSIIKERIKYLEKNSDKKLVEIAKNV